MDFKPWKTKMFLTPKSKLKILENLGIMYVGKGGGLRSLFQLYSTYLMIQGINTYHSFDVLEPKF